MSHVPRKQLMPEILPDPKLGRDDGDPRARAAQRLRRLREAARPEDVRPSPDGDEGDVRTR